jgi:endoglucanase
MIALISRREMTAIVAGFAAGGQAAAPPDPIGLAEWQEFRRRFMTADGRVVDSGNSNVSHTEGQGWALLFAVAHGDAAGFHQILDWTNRNLRRPEDALHAWRWRPGAVPAVEDPNNATDGDLYIAWALALAAERWRDRRLKSAAEAIAHDLLRLLLREAGGAMVLLPGLQGFEEPARLLLNPSYLAFPAYAAMARLVPDQRWTRLTTDGLALLRRARFGRWSLPPDWLAIDRRSGALALPERWPPRFSFDAIRVPLLLAWGGHGTEPALAAARSFWTDPGHATPPAWTDLTTNEIAGFPGSAGVQALVALAGAAGQGMRAPVGLPRLAEATDYYAASLILLVRLAFRSLGMVVRT